MIEKERNSFINTILNLRVAFQKATWFSVDNSFGLAEILESFKSDTYKTRITELRNDLENGYVERFEAKKRALPAVAFSGCFLEKRVKECLSAYNPIIVLDIDKLDPDCLEKFKILLSADPYVLSVWVSPSGRGLKGLIPINFGVRISLQMADAANKLAFSAIRDYLFKNYEIVLDKSGPDVTRLCFVCHDPNLILNLSVKPFSLLGLETGVSLPAESNVARVRNSVTVSRNLLHNPANKNNARDRQIVTSVIKFLEKTSQSITFSYDEWYRVAYALTNTFTFDLAERFFLRLSALDRDKFVEDSCVVLLKGCYQTSYGAITIKTIIYFAKLKGYKIADRGST